MHDLSGICIYSIAHKTIISNGHVKPIIEFHIPGGFITFSNETEITIIDNLITEGKRFSDSWEECIRYIEYMISEENALNCRRHIQDYTV
jgi:hypothetical protein